MAIPKIEWGASFANTWEFSGPIDVPVSETMPVGAITEAASGERTRWTQREDNTLAFASRFIPKNDDGSITGWTTASTGVREALAWLAEQNIGRFYPDKDLGGFNNFYLIDHESDLEEGGGFYRVRMTIRDSDGNPFTNA